MTKKVICSLFLFCVLCSVAYGSEPFPFTGTITADDVNVRAGPNINFETLCQLHTGDTAVVVDREYGWYKIKLPDDAAVYMNADFLVQRSGNIAVVNGNRVNVRAGPSEKRSIIGQLAKDAKVHIKQRKGSWYQLEPSEGMYGWVADRFIAFHSQDIPPPKVIVEPPRNIYRQGTTQKLQAEVSQQASRSTARKQDEGFSVVGRVEDLGRVLPDKDIRYKLIVDGETAYYLKGPRLLLDSFVYYKVRVYGTIKEKSAQEYPYPIIVVSKVKLVL